MQPHFIAGHQTEFMTTLLKRIPFLLFFSFFLVSHLATAQTGSKATLSGYIKSAGDGEALIGAGVYVEELKKGATTNVYGFYSLTLPKGKYTVKFIFLGYQTQTQTLDLESSQTVNIDLAEEVRQAKEVVITGEQKEVEANVKSTQMGVNKLDIKTISKIVLRQYFKEQNYGLL